MLGATEDNHGATPDLQGEDVTVLVGPLLHSDSSQHRTSPRGRNSTDLR